MRNYTRTLALEILTPLFRQKRDNTTEKGPKSKPPTAEEVEEKIIFLPSNRSCSFVCYVSVIYYQISLQKQHTISSQKDSTTCGHIILKSRNLTIFLIMTSFGPSCLLTETIWSERTINTMIFRDRMIRAAS